MNLSRETWLISGDVPSEAALRARSALAPELFKNWSVRFHIHTPQRKFPWKPR